METARAFGVLAIEAVGLALLAPALGGASRRTTAATLAVALLAGFGIARLAAPAGGVLGAQLAAHLLLGGWAMLLVGLGAVLGRAAGDAGYPLAALLGLALLASPFLVDPILEDSDRRARPAVREIALWVNPLAGAAAERLLQVDWLRRPVAYRTLTLGQYHAYYYPDPRWQGGLFFAAGILLVLLGRRRME